MKKEHPGKAVEATEEEKVQSAKAAMRDIHLTRLEGIRDFYPEGSETDNLVERALKELKSNKITKKLRDDITKFNEKMGPSTVTNLLTAVIEA